MSSIIENLHKILTSRYGKDVRQAIHDAIEDCYEDGRAISINVDPKVTTGTNIADIEINDTIYSLYAEGTVVSIEPKVTEGINIADITVDGQTTSLYGGSATIGGLTDVDITNPTEGQELSYDDTDNKWVNKTTRIECTMAQYEAWEQGGTLLSDVDYFVTDAPSSDGVYIDDNTTSATTVYSSAKVEDLLSDKTNNTNARWNTSCESPFTIHSQFLVIVASTSLFTVWFASTSQVNVKEWTNNTIVTGDNSVTLEGITFERINKTGVTNVYKLRLTTNGSTSFTIIN